MGAASKIAWTHHTFNPWRGCTKIAQGCANCYAETISRRNLKVLGQWGKDGTRVIASASMWREPVRWNEWATKGLCHACGGRGRSEMIGCHHCLGTGLEGDGAPYRARVFCASLADVFEVPETMPMSAWMPVCERVDARV